MFIVLILDKSLCLGETGFTAKFTWLSRLCLFTYSFGINANYVPEQRQVAGLLCTVMGEKKRQTANRGWSKHTIDERREESTVICE